MRADIKADKDRGEQVSLMEPLLISEGSRHRGGLTDLALDLAQKSAGFRRSLPENLLASVQSLIGLGQAEAVAPGRAVNDALLL